MHPVPVSINLLIGGLIFLGILIAFTALACGLTADRRLFPRTRLGWPASLVVGWCPRKTASVIRFFRGLRLVWVVIPLAHVPVIIAFILLFVDTPHA